VVWSAILDPEVLHQCVPGCQSMTGTVEDGFEAVVKQKVGPVSATFTGHVTFSDVVAGQSLKITGEGKGGVAGFAKGGAAVRFEPIETGTRLHYEVDASVGGKIAQLGSRIVDSFAKKMADEFFARFQDAVEPATPEELAAAAEAEAAAAAEAEALGEEVVADSGDHRKGWFRRMIGG
jgi:carbon monoxide dehydrogenase subunit G